MECIPLIIEPDPDDPDCAEVLVDGSIAGRPFRFMLDTGAVRTQVVADEPIAALPSHGQRVSPGVFATDAHALVMISDLVVGPLAAPALEVERIEAGQPDVCSALGMDVLGHRCCHLRFDTGMLILERSPAAGAGHALRVGDDGHAYVDVHWPGVTTARACLDTGAGITLVDQRFLHAHPGLFTPAGSSAGTDSTGARAEADMFMMTGAHIGGALFAPHKTASIDLSKPNAALAQPMDFILGYPTFRQANWLLDFPARRWALTRAPGSARRAR